MAHAASHAAILTAVPEQYIGSAAPADRSAAKAGLPILASAGAGLVTAFIGLGVVRASKREGALTPALAAAGMLSLHAALTSSAAVHAYASGLPEPLRAPMMPMKWFFRLLPTPG
jgi:hypothetical protein